MGTYFVILEFHLQAGFEDAALIVECKRAKEPILFDFSSDNRYFLVFLPPKRTNKSKREIMMMKKNYWMIVAMTILCGTNARATDYTTQETLKLTTPEMAPTLSYERMDSYRPELELRMIAGGARQGSHFTVGKGELDVDAHEPGCEALQGDGRPDLCRHSGIRCRMDHQEREVVVQAGLQQQAQQHATAYKLQDGY
jgi:hypothetical protein